MFDRLFGIVASTSAIQEVPGSIPDCTLEIFLEQGPLSLIIV